MTAAMRACIFVHRLDPGTVAVIDCSSPINPAVSVTNDAEAVVAHLYEWGRLRPTDLLVYKDTEGRWDGIRHRDGKFAGFKLIGATDVETVILAMRNRVIDEPPAAVL